MARPRVFISSTFYDLRQVRVDLERFVRDLGYEPVLFERGVIPYGPDESPASSAVGEVEFCDILVSIIGGRYGSDLDDQPYSVTQAELRKAVELGKPVYIFVEQSVLAEFHTYAVNKGNDGVRYRFVDNTRVFHFIEEVQTLPKNNPIAPFQTTEDITDYLREQWAGAMQRLLQERARNREVAALQDLNATAQTLKELVTLIRGARDDLDESIAHILTANHPIFRQIKSITRVPYRVYFTNHDELEAFLRARRFKHLESDQWDRPEFEEWRSPNGVDLYLKVYREVWDADGKLRTFTPEEWQEGWVDESEPGRGDEVNPDDLPF